jgi:hypothetical protein
VLLMASRGDPQVLAGMITILPPGLQPATDWHSLERVSHPAAESCCYCCCCCCSAADQGHTHHSQVQGGCHGRNVKCDVTLKSMTPQLEAWLGPSEPQTGCSDSCAGSAGAECHVYGLQHWVLLRLRLRPCKCVCSRTGGCKDSCVVLYRCGCADAVLLALLFA